MKKSYVVRMSIDYANGFTKYSHPAIQQIVNTNLGADTSIPEVLEIEDDLLICFYSFDISKSLKAITETMFSKTTIELAIPFLVHEQVFTQE